MPLLKLWGRPERPASRLHTRLSVLTLDDRAVPSSLLAAEDGRQDEIAWAATAYSSSSAEPTTGMTPDSAANNRRSINLPPEVVDLVVVQIGPGLYRITGRVIDEVPGGLVVTFGGVPSAEGQTTTTASDGTFTLTLQMQTDGSDTGNLSAATQDAAGQGSNVATYWVDPR